MKIQLAADSNARKNAQLYYDKAKEAKKKRENLVQAIADTKRKIDKLKRVAQYKKEEKTEAKKVRVVEEKEWFEKFHYFNTSEGLLVLCGRDSSQNEALVAKQLEKEDLFFHADIHGAAAVILKNGASASSSSLKEAAQFAASYSSAWKAQMHAVDVFAAKKEQLSKYSRGEFVAKGAFMIYGQKQWFKNSELKLFFCSEKLGEQKKLAVLPSSFGFASSERKFDKKILVVPGQMEKKDAAKELARLLGFDDWEKILRELPGNCELVI